MTKISPILVAAATVVGAVTALSAFAAGKPMMGKMGPSMRVQRSAFQGYYDGH